MSEEMEFRRYVLGTNTKYRPNYQNGLTYDTFEQAKDAAQRFAEKEHKTMYIFERMEVTSLVGEVRADKVDLDTAYECGKASTHAEPKTGYWIPVSERLPQKPDVYTVTDSKGDVVRFVFNDTESSREYWLRCVKAWIFIEPYREDGEAE